MSSPPASAPNSDPGLRARLEDAFWTRHSNPWSGGTRYAVSPVFAYALYRRNWRLLGLTLAFAVVNPVVFPPPTDTDNWLSHAVLAERAWLDAGHDTVGLDYPNVLNLLNVPVTLYALYAAARRRPVGAAVGTALQMALKTLWVEAVIRRTGVRGDHDASPP